MPHAQSWEDKGTHPCFLLTVLAETDIIKPHIPIFTQLIHV